MFSALKHTFGSIEDHLRKLFDHTEARFSQLKEIADSEIEKVADDIRQEFLDLRADVRSLASRVAAMEQAAKTPTAPAQRIESVPMVIKVPIPAGDNNPEVAALAAKHEDTLL